MSSQASFLLQKVAPLVMREIGPHITSRVTPLITEKVGIPLAKKVGLPIARRIGIPIARKAGNFFISKVGYPVVNKVIFKNNLQSLNDLFQNKTNVAPDTASVPDQAPAVTPAVTEKPKKRRNIKDLFLRPKNPKIKSKLKKTPKINPSPKNNTVPLPSPATPRNPSPVQTPQQQRPDIPGNVGRPYENPYPYTNQGTNLFGKRRNNFPY